MHVVLERREAEILAELTRLEGVAISGLKRLICAVSTFDSTGIEGTYVVALLKGLGQLIQHPPLFLNAEEDQLARAELEAEYSDLCERESKLMAELASVVAAEE